MAEFIGRHLHLVKKALAIAILTIERMPGPFQSTSDQADMKTLLDGLIESDIELERYVRGARIAITGEPGRRIWTVGPPAQLCEPTSSVY